MFTNSSSSLNVSHPLISASNSSNTISSNSFESLCSVIGNVIFTMFTFTNILFLFPFYISILYMGFQHCRPQRSAPAGMTMTSTDFFTYNMIIVEIAGVFGSVFYTVGNYIKSTVLMNIGMYLFDSILPGQAMFHLLTCFERYLAVVHPITYMRLRETHRVRIRNMSTGCVWLLWSGFFGIKILYWPYSPVTLLLSHLGISILVISFCCLSVLQVLTHPGPGEVGRNKRRVDQSKQRAFHMISVIMGVLLLKFTGLLIRFLIEFYTVMDDQGICLVMDVVVWLSVPSSLVLPLLFLHRAGKLSCFGKKTESG